MGKFDIGEKLLKDHEEKKKGDVDKVQNNKTDESEKKEVTNTQAEKLLQLTSNLELFHDEHKEPFTFINGGVMFFNSSDFKDQLSYQFYKAEKKAASSEALNQTISVLKSKAKYEGTMRTLHVRVAELNNAFYYDLGDGKAIKTTANGWNIVDAPILFRKYSHQQIQVVPIRGGNPFDLFDFVNVSKKNDHHILVLVLIISYFIPGFPHPIFCLHGAQGSGKTSFFKIIIRICDPSSAEVLITPNGKNDLIQTISHHHVCFFDNLSNISKEMSDILCSASTGGGFPKRKLYTDDESIMMNLKGCIGINGINQLINKPDLMERAIIIELERIDQKDRKTEKAICDSFNKKLPYILGGIFDALAKTMTIYPKVKLKEQPRMADFCKYGYAIAEALGIGGEWFLKAYSLNIDRLNEEVIQGDTLAQTVISFMSDKNNWSGTVGEVYKELKKIIGEDHPRDDHTFPKYPNKLRKYLDKIKANLLDRGISYSFGTHDKNGTPITIQKIEKVSSL